MRLKAFLFALPLLALGWPRSASAQEFRDIAAGITGIGTAANDTYPANVSIGDFDHDGRPDALVYGATDYGGNPVLEVWRNEGGRYSKFEDFHALGDSLTHTAAWADLNKDGYYELITWVRCTVPDSLGGHDSGFVRIYSYNPSHGRFEPQPGPFPIVGVLAGNDPLFRFADLDRDGYPDLLFSTILAPDHGSQHYRPTTLGLRNQRGTGWDPPSEIAPMKADVAVFGDMDGDGDPDLFLSGWDTTYAASVQVLRNTGTAFEPYATLSPKFTVQSADWGDYDKDGLADLVLSGGSDYTRLYQNTGAGFAVDTLSLPRDLEVDAGSGSVSFGDVNGDGYPDLLICGENFAYSNPHFAKLLVNDHGSFSDLEARLPAFWNAFASITDFDGDGAPDLILAGSSKDDEGRTAVRTLFYRNVRGDFQSAAVDSLSGKRPRWLDFDNDGDLDLIACGTGPGAPQGACRLYRNDHGNLVRQASALDQAYGEPEVGDLDGDGRVDVLIAGGGFAVDGLRWFRNTGNGFQETPLALDTAIASRIQHVRLGDYDGDGKPDLAVWGERETDGSPYYQCYSAILRNQGNLAFAAIPAPGLPNLCSGEMAWGDFDRDGDLDLLFAGDTAAVANNDAFTAVFRNDGGTFVRTADRFLGLSGASVAWGDFDGDGDLDFVETGSDMITGVAGFSGKNVPTVVVYRLVGGRFEEYFRPSLAAMGDAQWIDYDNDGDLDLIVSGRYYQGLPPNINLTLLYRNNGTSFTTLWPDDPFLMGPVAAADFDGDGDLDFAVCGSWLTPHGIGDGVPVLKLYKNSLLAPNQPPRAPSGLTSALGPASVRLAWGPSIDAETPPDGMQYNLRVGKSPGASDVLAPASAPSGFRLEAGPGNAGQIPTAALKGLSPGTYYWSVQGIDKQGAGSPFAGEASFTLGLPAPELLSAEAGPGSGAVTLRWRKLPQPQFQRYLIHYGTSASPTALMDSVARAGDTVLVVSGLTNGATYHFRLSAQDLGGNVSAYSAEAAAVPDGTPPAVPAPFTAVSGDRAVTLSWPAATESDFLCYLIYQRNASGPVARIDSITDAHATSKVVTGLKNGTPYSFLIAAVDRVGNHSGFSPEAVAIPAYLLTPAAPSLAFGKLHLGAAKDSVLRLANGSGLRVPVDSVRIVNDAFSLPALPASLPANAETTLTVRFAPAKPMGGDFQGVLKLYYGGAQIPLEIDLSGTAAAPPWCRIDKVTPADVPWDTASTLSFLATANDSDNAGEGDRITAYLWSSNLAGPIGMSTSGFTLRPSALGIGTHDITLRVVDNEGDTSLAAHATVNVRSRKPLVRIDSISPRGLIIRGADRPRFRCTAYDLDEGADAAHDSLHAFALYSTLQGRISGAKDTTLDSSALSLGLHGFYAMAVDNEGDTSWSDTAWVPVQAGVGLALIAAGTDFGDNLYFYQNIAPACNWAYSKLRQRGFTDSLITYFNPIGWQSIGAGYKANSNIVDETRMTTALLRERILGFRDRVRNGVPLLITLIGHGGHAEKQNGVFYLGPNESVTPDSLDAWLDTYNSGTGDTLRTPIVLVLDFCYAGSFIPKLRSSTQNRIVIASSSADRQAYYRDGLSFSYAFFKQIAKGGNLTQAWNAGRAWSDANAPSGQSQANPQANADLDDTPNDSADFARLSAVYIGGSQQNQSPEASWKSASAQISASARTLSIRALPDGPIPVDTAWFALLTPDFDPSGTKEPAYAPLTRDRDGAFTATVKLDNVLSGDYLVLVYGSAGGLDLMPISARTSPNVPVAMLAGSATRFELGQNYPNPALGLTWLPFALTQRGPVTLTLWDMRGAEVRTLAVGTFKPGRYLLKWDGRDGQGRPVPAGIYLYRLTAPEGTLRKKLIWR